ncbi:MAG: cobyrinate a,c-diamide synthase [Rhodospirillaceae bacterium]
MPRLFISAAHKSSGKTMVSLGLVRALRQRGRVVQPFKKGPDYIDPLWLGSAAGRACYNLDYNTQTPEAIRALLARHEAAADLAVIEGTKGLYDGVETDGSTCNAALARLIEAPVVLVVDCVGMTRGIAPLLLGYQHFDGAPTFAGVILNKVGGARHESKLRAAVEAYTDFPVLGAVPMHTALKVAERHLGLIPANEQAASEAVVEGVAAVIAASIDLDAVEAAAHQAPALPAPAGVAPLARTGLRIAIAHDSAFGFYYPDDLDALAAEGAELVPVHTLHDTALPPDIDGLIIGGGFPETHMAALEANAPLRAAIRDHLRDGLPCYAECGGLMYLSRSITWHGERFAMVGAVPADTVMNERPRGRGYVRLRPTDAAVPWRVDPAPDGAIRAHEFHYSALEHIDGPQTFAYDVERGDGVDGHHDGLVIGNTVAGYTHMRGNWVRPFIHFVKTVKAKGTIGEPARPR